MSSPGTRVLLLADTHGELDPRIAELAQDCTLAVHAGDVGAKVVLETLAAAAGRVLAVCGNNDVRAKWLGDLADLAALPERLDPLQTLRRSINLATPDFLNSVGTPVGGRSRQASK